MWLDDMMPTAYVPMDEQPFETAIHLSDGTFVKSFKVAKANTMLPQHSHAYSHTSYIATGAVKAWKEGVFLRDVTAPDGILIEAHAKHMFQTLADNTTILCIHSVAEGEDPEIEEEHHVEVMGRPPRERLSMDGFTFQDEPIEQWYEDAKDLFREHMAATGQGLEDWSRKNIVLGRQLDAAGAMQIITARSSNGAMQGYLMSVIGPSLDNPAARVAQQLPIYASPDCPGLGMRLQRESIAGLREKGVTEILGRAGTRGSGPRLGTMYRRLGFDDAGHLYRLET
jgi:hypothetical protein